MVEEVLHCRHRAGGERDSRSITIMAQPGTSRSFTVVREIVIPGGRSITHRGLTVGYGIVKSPALGGCVRGS